MKNLIGNFANGKKAPLFLAMLLLVSFKAQAATTVTVDDNNAVQVSQTRPQTVVVNETPLVVSQVPVVVNQVPMAVTQTSTSEPVLVNVVSSSDFEGEVERIDRSARTIDVLDTDGRTRQVLVTQETIDTYNTGDFVQIHAYPNVREVTFVREESNLDLEGRIINVDSSHNTIMVHDTNGRDRRITLKQGMISTYKVDDYVRIHLMADLKEAKMIRTIR